MIGHVHRSANGHISKDVLYGEPATGTRTIGRPYLRYKDTCRCVMKMEGIDQNNWETVASDRDGGDQLSTMA